MESAEISALAFAYLTRRRRSVPFRASSGLVAAVRVSVPVAFGGRWHAPVNA